MTHEQIKSFTSFIERRIGELLTTTDLTIALGVTDSHIGRIMAGVPQEKYHKKKIGNRLVYYFKEPLTVEEIYKARTLQVVQKKEAHKAAVFGQSGPLFDKDLETTLSLIKDAVDRSHELLLEMAKILATVFPAVSIDTEIREYDNGRSTDRA